jgi:hypothetical protein
MTRQPTLPAPLPGKPVYGALPGVGIPVGVRAMNTVPTSPHVVSAHAEDGKVTVQNAN